MSYVSVYDWWHPDEDDQEQCTACGDPCDGLLCSACADVVPGQEFLG